MERDSVTQLAIHDYLKHIGSTGQVRAEQKIIPIPWFIKNFYEGKLGVWSEFKGVPEKFLQVAEGATDEEMRLVRLNDYDEYIEYVNALCKLDTRLSDNYSHCSLKKYYKYFPNIRKYVVMYEYNLPFVVYYSNNSYSGVLYLVCSCDSLNDDSLESVFHATHFSITPALYDFCNLLCTCQIDEDHISELIG